MNFKKIILANIILISGQMALAINSVSYTQSGWQIKYDFDVTYDLDHLQNNRKQFFLPMDENSTIRQIQLLGYKDGSINIWITVNRQIPSLVNDIKNFIKYSYYEEDDNLYCYSCQKKEYFGEFFYLLYNRGLIPKDVVKIIAGKLKLKKEFHH